MKVLFVSVENSCRSQMAEAFARTAGAEAHSAGLRPSRKISPKAIEAMHEIGYDLSTHKSKPLADVPEVDFDVVVTIGCGDECPPLKAARREDWEIKQRKGRLGEFRAIRNVIELKVQKLLADPGAA
jgi:protein-tyrosine-phosphatase